MARTKRLSWAVAVAACLSLLAFTQHSSTNPAAASEQSDDPTLQTLVDMYLATLAKKDLTAFKKLWGETADPTARISELEQLFALDDYTYSNAQISRVAISSDRASLRIAFDLTSKRTMILDRSSRIPRARVEHVTRNLSLVKQSGEWRLARDVSAVEDLATALLETKTDSDKTAILEKEGGLITTDLREELLERATGFFVRQQLAEALDAYALARVIAERANDREGVAAALAGMGNIHRARREYAMAEEHYRRALAEVEALQDRDQVAGLLEYIGFVQHSAGKLAQSVESYRKALAQYEAAKNDEGRANSLENIGTVLYDQGEYGLAVGSYTKSLKLYQRLGSAVDVAGMFNNIGSSYYAQGDLVLALENYVKALNGFEKLGNEQAIAATLNNIGGAYYSQGEYEQAIESYQKSLVIVERLGIKEGEAAALFGIALVHYSRGDYTRALDYYNRNLPLREASGDNVGIATTLRNIGLVHYRQRNYTAALESYQKSLKLYEQLGKGADTAALLNSIGGIYFTQANYPAAREYYQKALAGFEASKDGAGVAIVLASLGSLYHSQGDYPAALDHYQKSLRQYESLGDKSGATSMLAHIASVTYSEGRYIEAIEIAGRASVQAKQIDDTGTLWRARATAGAALRNLNETERARAELESAINVIDSMRGRLVGGDQEPERFFQDKSSPFVAMVELLIAENRPEEALNYAERIKAHTLLDVIAGNRVRITKAMSAREQSGERMLINKIISLNSQIAREKQRKQPDQLRLINLRNGFEKAINEYDIFKKRLYAAHPRLKAQRGEAAALKFEEAGVLFPDSHTAILEYLVTEGKTYLFVLTKSGDGGSLRTPAARRLPARADLKVYVIPINRKQLVERALRFRESIEARTNEFQQPARELHDLLVGPAREQLAGKAALVVIPDAALGQAPFQALRTAENRYLIEDYSVSYAPSLTALREMMKPRKRLPVGRTALYDLLAFGNPIGDETENEVKALGQFYGERQSRIYTGAKAREERFKAEAATARVLHIATGGRLSDASPMYSYIAVSQASAKEDGLLQAGEIVKLDLKAEIVVVSATQTAREQAAGGEGLTALAWAFFVAGPQAVVASEWRAEPRSTADLMLSFHQKLKGARPAEALRQAAINLMKNEQRRHPFYWAGFRAVAA